jgi:hypothetical protein
MTRSFDVGRIIRRRFGRATVSKSWAKVDGIEVPTKSFGWRFGRRMLSVNLIGPVPKKDPT